MARYAIGDIHGCALTFRKALKEINFTKEDSLVVTGDYVDRGPRSREVVQDLIDLIAEGYDVVCLKGNHEDFMLQARIIRQQGYTAGVFHSWLGNGGDTTLKSYGYTFDHTDWTKCVPKAHWDFFNSLKVIHETYDYVFSHATLDFSKDDPIKESSEETCIWSRGGTVDNAKIGGRMLVNGHTVTKKDRMIELLEGGKRAIIDRGCVFPSADYGHLAVLNLDNRQLRFIRNCDADRSYGYM